MKYLTPMRLFVTALLGQSFALLLTACHSNGPVTGAIAAGTAGVLAVFDQMFSAGSLNAEQHTVLVNGIRDLSTAASQAITPGQLGGGLLAMATTLLGVIRLWRGAGNNAPASSPAAPPPSPAPAG